MTLHPSSCEKTILCRWKRRTGLLGFTAILCILMGVLLWEDASGPTLNLGGKKMIPQRFGLGNVDWQQRINWEDLRKKRVDRAHQFLAKYGIGSAIVYNHDRKRYLSSVFNHVYSKHVPTSFVLLIRDAGFPYVPIEEELDAQRVKEDCPWLDGRLLTEHELLHPPPYRYQVPDVAKRQWSTVASQIKGLLKKHGVADMLGPRRRHEPYGRQIQ